MKNFVHWIKNMNRLGSDNEKLKIINFVATSDSDDSYLKDSNKNKAKNLRLFYMVIIFVAVVLSFIPMFLPPNQQIQWTKSLWNIVINIVIFVIFIVDYILRWISYPVRASKLSMFPLFFFPLTGVSILIIISILPTVVSVFAHFVSSDNYFIKFVNVFTAVKIIRLLLFLKIVPAFKIFSSIFSKNKILLVNVFMFVFVMVIIFALMIYSVEGGTQWVDAAKYEEIIGSAPDPSLANNEGKYEISINPLINSFWDSLYFTFITITTIGYGDISPKTNIGRGIVILDALVGIMVFSIPAGIITGSFIVEIQEIYKNRVQVERNYEFEKLSWFEKIYFNVKNKGKAIINSNFNMSNRNLKNKNYYIKIKGEDVLEEVIINKILSTLTDKNIIDCVKNEEEKTLVIFFDNKKHIPSDFYKLTKLLKYEIKESNVSS